MSKAQLGRLIDLPDDALQQVLDYAATLSKADAADHFANLLGSAPAAVEFVSAFNARRHDPAAGSASAVAAASNPSIPSNSGRDAVEPAPKHQRQKKKKAPLHTPPPRQVMSLAPPPGAVYNKKDTGDDYMWGRSSGTSTPLTGAASIIRGATPVSASTTPPPQPSPHKPPPPQTQSQSQSQSQPQQNQQRSTGGGSLIQDALAPKPKNRSSNNNSSGHTVTKVNITGGTAMHGASTALADFDAAIRSLEVSTNPTLAKNNSEDNVAARRCNCVATRHPLQTAAPNCQSCGKVICVKEGLGPCTSCGAALLSPAEVQAMIKELRAERGREKMAADREVHRRTDVAMGGRNKMGASMTHAQHASQPHMIAGQTKWGGDDDGFVSLAEAAKVTETQNQTAEAKARAHRDKLLAFQAQNAQRTTVRDEAADFDVSDAMAGSEDGPSRNLWATPEERARELRRQQKVLREMEWNARPEYEKRQQVLSIDVTGRKVFRKTVVVERPPTLKSDEDEGNENDEYGHGGRGAAVLTDADGNKDVSNKRTAGGGAFSKNPLLGHLIKPVYDARSRAKAAEAEKAEKEKDKGKGKGKDKDESEEKDGHKGKAKGKAEGGREKEGSSKEADKVDVASPLPGRRDDPNAASRWRRVQDDLNNNDAVILDGGIYGTAAPTTMAVGDEPECG